MKLRSVGIILALINKSDYVKNKGTTFHIFLFHPKIVLRNNKPSSFKTFFESLGTGFVNSPFPLRRSGSTC